MAEHIPKILERGFQNWLKANLALNIAKDGIEYAVLHEINTFHQDVLNAVLTPEQILNKDFCKQCAKENILQCPTRGICVVKLGQCSLHHSQQKYYRPCPKQVCDRLRDQIKRRHRFNFPSWKNTTTEKWCENPWQLAKCYLPPDGYIAINTIAETDLNGILSLIINHAVFKKKINEKACEEVRDKGRNIRHSPHLSIDANDLNTCLDTLITFLDSSSLFQTDFKAATSVQKLKMLKSECLTITTRDVTQVLLDVIRENTCGSVKQINETTTRHLVEVTSDIDKLKVISSQSLKDILTAKETAICDIGIVKDSAIKEFESAAQQKKSDINKELESSAETLTSDMKEELEKAQLVAEASMKQIEQSSIRDITKAASNINVPLQRFTEEDYQLLKNELKEDLLTFNRANHSTLPLSPLIGEDNSKLTGFYVMPALNSVEVQKTEFRGPGSESKVPVPDLKGVFFKRSNQCKNVILTSEAGHGKTAFCKRLVLTWCNAHQINTTEIGEFSDDDLNVMREFNYLFLIPLRDSFTADCDIDDMIQNQIIQYLSQSYKYSVSFVQTMLHREASLVILDGLDEWSHPEQKHSNCRRNPEYIPHRKAREKCTILTSTRPWKLSIANLKSSEKDYHIEIGSLEYQGSNQLMRNTFTKLKVSRNIPGDIEPNIEAINTEIRSGSVDEFKGNPLLLTYLICLWCDGKPLGQSRCEVYSNILDVLLLRAKENNTRMLIKEFALNDEDSAALPICFETRTHIRSCYKFLISLGQLAFKTLFNTKNKERSLVFDSTSIDSILTPDAYQFSLCSGLLTQSKVPGKLASRDTRVSFSHKTFQEFFAALYIQSQSDLTGISQQVLKRCNTVETILEMSNVFIFLCGLGPERVSFLFKKLRNCINNDEMTITYRQEYYGTVIHYQIFKDIQTMCLACVKEQRIGDFNLVYQDIVLDKDCNNENNSRLLQSLVMMNIKNIKSIQYRQSASEEATRETIRLFNMKEIHTLEKLLLECPIRYDDLEAVLIGSVDTLKQLSIFGYGWRNDRIVQNYNTITNAILSNPLNNMRNQLEALVLGAIKESHCCLDSLVSYLTQSTSMKQIYLYDVKCTDHGDTCPGFNMDLSQHFQLNTFGFGEVPLSHLQINTSTLEKCTLGEVRNKHLLSSFVRKLPLASKLKRLHCYSLITDLDTVFETIPLLIHLQTIRIFNTDIRNITLSPDMVDIKLLVVFHIKMTSVSFDKLVREVKQLQQSVRVELLNCTISPTKEYERIKKYILSSERFVVLRDGENDIVGQNIYSFVFETVSLNT